MGRYMPEHAPTIFISTGELSGEMHAAHLVTALQQLREEQHLPPALVEGNGSQRMSEAGVQLLFNVATWSELGIVHNLLKASFFHRVVTATARYIMANQPDMVILVDNRVLNLNLAKLLRRRGYPGRIVFYVAPVRWESLYDPTEHARSLRNPRFTDIKELCDLALLIYPVSLEVYEELEIPHEYVGHPLCELAKPQLTDEAFSELTCIRLDAPRPPMIIGVLPGSRRREVQWIGPPMYRALRLVSEAFAEDDALPSVHCVSPVSHPEILEPMLDAARAAGLGDLTLIDGAYTYDLMARARLMLVKSGTGLHECMLIGVPAIMCYRVPPYLAWLLRRVMRFSMPAYGLPNLLAGEPVVPELIQEDCTHLRIAEMIGSLLFEEKERKLMLDAFAKLKEKVCRPEPLRRAARHLIELLPS